MILFTSGTSGRPKGALLSERNLWASAVNLGRLANVSHASRFLVDSPMFHIIGLVTPTLLARAPRNRRVDEIHLRAPTTRRHAGGEA